MVVRSTFLPDARFLLLPQPSFEARYSTSATKLGSPRSNSPSHDALRPVRIEFQTFKLPAPIGLKIALAPDVDKQYPVSKALGVALASPSDDGLRFLCGDTAALASVDQAHHGRHRHAMQYNRDKYYEGCCAPDHINLVETLFLKSVCQILNRS